MVFIQAHFLYKYAELFVCTSLQFYQQDSIQHFITISTAVQFCSEFGVKHSSVSSLLVRKDYAVLYTEKICIRINYYYDGMENIPVNIVCNQL